MDSKGRKYGNIHYDRKKTKLEEELEARGWCRRSAWPLVCNAPNGKEFNHDTFDAIMDNASMEMGCTKIERIASACNVDFITVYNWIRLDVEPERMSQQMYTVYKKQIMKKDNAMTIRWYLAMFIRNGFPVMQVLDAVSEGYSFDNTRRKKTMEMVRKEMEKKGLSV